MGAWIVKKKEPSQACWIAGQSWDEMSTCTHNPASSRKHRSCGDAHLSFLMLSSSSTQVPLGSPENCHQRAAGVAGWLSGRALAWYKGGLGFDPSAIKRGSELMGPIFVESCG